jgi:hypothetical protein
MAFLWPGLRSRATSSCFTASACRLAFRFASPRFTRAAASTGFSLTSRP